LSKKRFVALVSAAALVSAIAIPAGAAPRTKSNFALKGEARGLELAIAGQGVTLGLALAQSDSTPRALGVGAGQCELLGAEADPTQLPCSDDNTARSEYPGDPGSTDLICKGGLPAPLGDVIKLDAACGSSKTTFKRGVAQTVSQGKVASLSAKLPVGLSLVPLDVDVNQVDQIVDTLTQALAPVLDVAPAEVREVLEGVEETADDTTDDAQGVVDGLLEIIQGLDATDALKIELGISDSKITRKGSLISSSSEAAGAKIGLIGLPGVGTKDELLQAADPLTNGLVIIEVGTSRASASVNKATAASSSAASAAIVTVRVRDITKPEPTYVEVSVAPGETVTVLAGTPAESTITAADSTTEQGPGSASAVADAVRLHLLKGVNGGVELGIAGTTAIATADIEEEEVAPPVVKGRPPTTLPLTGAQDMSIIALVMLVAAAGVLVLRRRTNNN